MIETDKRKAVFLLHQEGQSVREIARLLSLSRNTVRAIIAQCGAPATPQPRTDKLPLDESRCRIGIPAMPGPYRAGA
jgi:transposase-like protein